METSSPDETRDVAERLGELLRAGSCVALYGELGAGKTVFARGLVKGLGVSGTMRVTSPTFVIVSEYEGRLSVHHVDAYRLSSAAELVNLGSRELFFSQAVSIVEWADKVEEALPDERINVSLRVAGQSARTLEISASGNLERDTLARLGDAIAQDAGP